MKHYVLNSAQYLALYEGYNNNIEGGNAKELIALGRVRMSDGNIVETRKFVDVVNGAISYFRSTYPYEYKYFRGGTIIYLLDNLVTDTMCVNDKMVYCINVEFLYNNPPYGLGMDAMNVFKILYHEVMHTMLTHVPRMHEYNKKATKKSTWTELNIAGDFEINGMMVADRVCTPDFWKILPGCCYDEKLIGLPFETILRSHKDAVDQQKGEAPPMPPRGGGKQKPEKIPTSKDWKAGHREARELIRKLYKDNKRNAKQTLAEIQKLIETYNGDVEAILDDLKKRYGV